MGFADVTDDIRQISGNAKRLRLEGGCISAAATSAYPPTQLSHIVGGLIFGCVTTTQCSGRALLGSACAGGAACFTLNNAPNQALPYLLVGW